MTTSLGAFDMMHSATMQWDMADWNMHGSGQPIEGVFNTGVFYTPWSAADLALFHSHGRPSSVSSEDSVNSFGTAMRENLVTTILGDVVAPGPVVLSRVMGGTPEPPSLGGRSVWDEGAASSKAAPPPGCSSPRALSFTNSSDFLWHRTHCRLHMDIHGQGKRVAGRSAASSQHTLIVSELASSPPTSRHSMDADYPRHVSNNKALKGASEDNNTAEYVAAAGRSLTAGLLQALNTRPPRFEESHAYAEQLHARADFWQSRSDANTVGLLTDLSLEIEGLRHRVAEAALARLPYRRSAVHKVLRAMQELWPRAKVYIFGSVATGLALPSSDIDLVVYLPPVRNLPPIEEAGILEGRNGVKETIIQQALRHLSNQDWVVQESLKPIEKTAVPIIMMTACCRAEPENLPLRATAATDSALLYGAMAGVGRPSHILSPDAGGDATRNARSLNTNIDISFGPSPTHRGLGTVELVRELSKQFPHLTPLALVLKQFLKERNLHAAYTGGLSSYCLVLLITTFLQQQRALEKGGLLLSNVKMVPSPVQLLPGVNLAQPIGLCKSVSSSPPPTPRTPSGLASPEEKRADPVLGRLLLDFLNFFGKVFDPRISLVSLRAEGNFLPRDRFHGVIDPLFIEDPFQPDNNIGRNCFRVLQIQKAFAAASVVLEQQLMERAELGIAGGSVLTCILGNDFCERIS